MACKSFHDPTSIYTSSPRVQSHLSRVPRHSGETPCSPWGVCTPPSRKTFFKTKLNPVSSVKPAPAGLSRFIHSTNILKMPTMCQAPSDVLRIQEWRELTAAPGGWGRPGGWGTGRQHPGLPWPPRSCGNGSPPIPSAQQRAQPLR